jgi:NADH:ubiquinone oxidoreductase subunit 5 (subunit L)/multisubunit Na+/H+ antiporter MnhA subunit
VAAVFHILNHATFKASLFMAVGIIDHETGTRDIRRLSGLWRAMPITGHTGLRGQRGHGGGAAAQRLHLQGNVLL